MIIGCSIFAVLLIIGIIRTTLNMSAKEKEAKAKEEEAKAKDVDIKRLTKEVDKWEQKVKVAYGNASSHIPDYKQSDFLTGVAHKPDLSKALILIAEDPSLKKVEILMKNSANLLLRRLHLCVLKGSDTFEVDKWNHQATVAKTFY